MCICLCLCLCVSVYFFYQCGCACVPALSPLPCALQAVRESIDSNSLQEDLKIAIALNTAAVKLKDLNCELERCAICGTKDRGSSPRSSAKVSKTKCSGDTPRLPPWEIVDHLYNASVWSSCLSSSCSGQWPSLNAQMRSSCSHVQHLAPIQAARHLSFPLSLFQWHPFIVYCI